MHPDRQLEKQGVIQFMAVSDSVQDEGLVRVIGTGALGLSVVNMVVGAGMFMRAGRFSFTPGLGSHRYPDAHAPWREEVRLVAPARLPPSSDYGVARRPGGPAKAPAIKCSMSTRY